MKYSRHCYKHLAGYVGVKVTEALVNKGVLKPADIHYEVTDMGWKWLDEELEIHEDDFAQQGKRLSKQCLDFSERKSHLGGKLGETILSKMLETGWAHKVPDSREIRFTPRGKEWLKDKLGLRFAEAKS